MDSSRHRRIKELFLAACEKAPEELAEFLTDACGDDTSIRSEVESMLAADAGESGGLRDLVVRPCERVGRLPAMVSDFAERLVRSHGLDLDALATASDPFARRLAELVRREGRARYVLGGELARGGMGAVLEVFETDLRRTLAMKVILEGEEPVRDTQALVRFLEEAQVTGRLAHPGVVPVHEVGVDEDGRVYFTMQLVKGRTLHRVIELLHAEAEDWTLPRVLGVLLRTCETMAYAHDRGVVHRDLKPANVMVGEFGEVYVMDWGLARPADPGDAEGVAAGMAVPASSSESASAPLLTTDGTVVGTPSYMPPEQARGEMAAVGPHSDVYAAGAILYHVLCGRMPYVDPETRTTAHELLAEVRERAPRPILDLRPDSPVELVAICEKAMAREIDERYPSMLALAHDLRAYLENRVVTAHARGPLAELRKWVARHPGVTATAAAAVFVVAVLSTWFVLNLRAKERVARRNEQIALAKEAEAEAERDRVLRLSDMRRLDSLLADADALWPAHPEHVDPMRAWLRTTETLLKNLALHEAALAEVRARGTALPHPREADLAVLREHLAEHAAGRAVLGEEFDDEAARIEHVEELESAIAVLEVVIARERGYDFGQDVDVLWWHDAVRDVVVGLHALQGDDAFGPTVAGIGARLAFAEAVGERTTTGSEAAAKWAAARSAIRDHPMYGGLDLEPQIGLLPLGPDPNSTLWEFGHLQTGELAVRDPKTGGLATHEETGLVFVLIPGGTYRIGAQPNDPAAPHFDGNARPDEAPVHEVTLSPFFLSKYEMTQGQWVRTTGQNPSLYPPVSDHVESLRHPVEQVSWDMCRETLDRLALVLPTEAQWEAACRAGTETPWSTGQDRDSLRGATNLADRAGKRAGGRWPAIEEWPELDDGAAIHAPVGSYRANGYGLHDMHGNVWEWCRDGYGGYDVAAREGDGLRDGPGASLRVYRGGGFDVGASSATSSDRVRNTPGLRVGMLGVRPARSLDEPSGRRR